MAEERIAIGVGWDRDDDQSGGRDPFRAVENAILADTLGLDGVWIGDSPSNRRPSYEPIITLSYIASRSERIKLGTAIFLLPLSHPTRLAKQLASLDALSRGRVILGIGPGGEYPKMYEGFGIPVSERGPRTNEHIRLLRSLWTEPVSSFRGRFLSFEGIIMEPKPVQRPIPIWVGGRPGGMEIGPDGQPRFKSRTAAIKRAAMYGDGWMPYYISLESYRESVEQVRSTARENGRDPSRIAMALSNSMTIGDSLENALEKGRRNLRYGEGFSKEKLLEYDLVGSAREIVGQMERFIEAGCRHFICKLQSSVEELPAHIEYMAKEIAPQFR